MQTLRQIARQAPRRPHLRIEDAPALAVRGYMLDLSRDKVPTMARLLGLIDELAELKFNQLQLYTEHTFAFPGHEQVWGMASPLTADEVRVLDQACLAHGIELVPCMNTCGHWERWLRHPPYFRYAECPHGWRRPDGHGMPWGSTLYPGAESLALLEELFAAYLPLFSSPQVNIGGDEPWELGMGRSRDRCEREGRAGVYRDYLGAVIAAAQRHKPQVQFWSDILLADAGAWPSAPAGSTALLWGYEAGHPFASEGQTLAERNIPFIICPGTSTWNSLGTRLGNALTNLREATTQARSLGAAGCLLTDWGDHGHHQPDLLSIPARAAFAEAAWHSADFSAPRLRASLQPLLFPHESPAFVEALFELGQLHTFFHSQPPNRLPFTQVLTTPEHRLEAVLGQFTAAEAEAAEKHLRTLRATLGESGNASSSPPVRAFAGNCPLEKLPETFSFSLPISYLWNKNNVALHARPPRYARLVDTCIFLTNLVAVGSRFCWSLPLTPRAPQAPTLQPLILPVHAPHPNSHSQQKRD